MLAADAWLLSARWEDTIAGTAAAGVGILAVSLTVRFSPGVPLGLALLAGSYAAALGSREVDVDLSATLYVALFFLAAELAYWSLELSPGFIRRRGSSYAASSSSPSGLSQPSHLPASCSRRHSNRSRGALWCWRSESVEPSWLWASSQCWCDVPSRARTHASSLRYTAKRIERVQVVPSTSFARS